MYRLRLLERIREWERHPEMRGDPGSEDIVASVMRHLSLILNTKQGTALIDDDFGVPDFTNLGSTFGQDTIPDIQRSIADVVRKYEPRLASVNVTYIPQSEDVLQVAFKLEAVIKGETRDVPVVFETVIDPDGKISVKD
jgi:type VI secretion system protein